MFFGNMQSFYRRNSIYNPSSSQSSKQSKEQIKRKHLKKSIKDYKDESEDYRSRNNLEVRRNSFSTARDGECEEAAEDLDRSNVPVIRIGMYEPETSKKSFNILKEKEKALWYNSSPVLDDNSERLGPNKNKIIEDTLEIERRRSGHWEH